ncbi:glycosyltransferase [Opitutaceae bacterium TAV4]|nr:glycosyltransferase [Opitutaceae bacterium TAV4]
MEILLDRRLCTTGKEFIQYLMKLTAVIPTIGRLPFLDFSIGSLLAQRIPFDEILIVDNSSDQNLQQLSRWGRMTGVRWERSGGGLPATQNWNLAVRLCSYEYVTIFGDDDIARENFCDELRTGLRNSGMVFCNFDVIDEHGDIVRRGKTLPMQFTAAQFRHARMRGELYTVIPGFAFRQKDFIDIGGFRHLGLPKDLYCDDDLWFRLSERAGSLTVARGTSWCYRIHDGQVGHVFSYRTFLQNIDEFVKLMMEALKELGVVEKEPISKRLE